MYEEGKEFHRKLKSNEPIRYLIVPIELSNIDIRILLAEDETLNITYDEGHRFVAVTVDVSKGKGIMSQRITRYNGILEGAAIMKDGLVLGINLEEEWTRERNKHLVGKDFAEQMEIIAKEDK